MAAQCPHVEQVRDVDPNGEGCEECLKLGDTWVHLRMYLTCGHVGCCDSSRNRHATKQKTSFTWLRRYHSNFDACGR